MEAFDFISTTDKPALLAISTPEFMEQTREALLQFGYKVHHLDSHDQFLSRFYQVNYQVVVIEETFGSDTPGQNPTLKLVQTMPMNQRRHATIILLGSMFETLNGMQAWTQSVHAVVNYSDMGLIGQMIQKTVADNELFLTTFRDVQERLYHKPK